VTSWQQSLRLPGGCDANYLKRAMPQRTRAKTVATSDTVNSTICDAIRRHRWLQLRIGARTYVVEPHAYGVMPEGDHAQWAWHPLVVGHDDSQQNQRWVLRYLDEMRNLKMLPETFEGSRPGYSVDRLPLLTVYARL